MVVPQDESNAHWFHGWAAAASPHFNISMTCLWHFLDDTLFYSNMELVSTGHHSPDFGIYLSYPSKKRLIESWPTLKCIASNLSFSCSVSFPIKMAKLHKAMAPNSWAHHGPDVLVTLHITNPVSPEWYLPLLSSPYMIQIRSNDSNQITLWLWLT